MLESAAMIKSLTAKHYAKRCKRKLIISEVSSSKMLRLKTVFLEINMIWKASLLNLSEAVL
jgi:hypothetical protein